MMKWLTNLFVKGYVQANEFITTGGTSSDFVKGDGSLDSNSYALDSDLDNHLLNTTDTLTGDLTVTEQISANGGNSTQWNEAYNWGDHSEEGYATEDWVDSQGYLQSFTETDPTVPSHVKSITTTEKSNWNEAYGWGDHLLEGYLTSVGWTDLTGSQSAINLSGFNDDLDYDNYGSWNLKTNGVQRKTIQSGDNLDLVAGTNIGLSYGADGKVTINSSFNNTTYTAGTGLDLTGTEFSFDTVWGDGRYLQSFTETDPTVPSYVKNITTGNISNWNGKAELSDIKNGILTLSTGTGLTGSSSFSANQSGDETFNVAIASGYTLPTNNQVSNWDTAHTWGDHSTEGYLTSNQIITLSGDVSGSGSTDISVTIAPSSVEAGMLNNNIISGKTALTSGLVSTDELMISDAGIIKRMDVSVLQSYMQSNLAFSNNSGTVTSVATGTGLTGGTITSTGTISLDSSSISSLALADTALQPSDLNGYATETYVDTEIANLVDNSPAALDTLNELAAALGDDPNFATTVSNQIGLKADKSTSILAGTGLNGGGTLAADRTLSVKYGTAAGTAAQGNDSRLSNSREWTATVVSQAEAETGTATTARKWTAQRVRQAILGWWNGSPDKTKLDGIESGAQVNSVTSVAGQTGDVTLTHTDVNAAPASHTHPLSQITDAGDLASLNTNASTSNFLRGDGTWATPPNTNTTYSEISTAEIDAGTASTSRAISGRRMKYALDKKSDTGHGHVIGDVTGLQAAIDSKANITTQVIAGTGLSGGGTLAANRTLSVNYGTTAGTAAQGNDSRFHTHSNKAVLDGITPNRVSGWDDIVDLFLAGKLMTSGFENANYASTPSPDAFILARNPDTSIGLIPSNNIITDTSELLNRDFTNPIYAIYDDPADHPYFLMGGDGSGVAVVSPEQAKEQLNISLQPVIDNSIVDDPNGDLGLDFTDAGWVYFLFPSGAIIEDDGAFLQIRADDVGLTGSKGTLSLNPTGNFFRDKDPSPKGIQYENDYSATYTNRSLVDKEYVDNVVASSGDGHKKTFLKTFANPHNGDINIDSTEFSVGDEWIITYQDSVIPTIILDGSKKAKIIDVGVDFQPNVKSRIYLHLVEIVGTYYYFDTTITPITLLP